MATYELRYIVLPPSGFLDPLMQEFDRPKPFATKGSIVPTSMGRAIRRTGADQGTDVIDKVAEDGPKLVSMSPVIAHDMRKIQNSFRVVPVRRYRPALRPMQRIRVKGFFSDSPTRTRIRVFVQSKTTGAPIRDAVIIALVNEETGHGIRRRSAQSGQATLTFSGTSTVVEKLFVYPPNGFWGHYSEGATLRDGQTIELEPINLAVSDVLQETYPKRSGRETGTGKGVRVGVIDTGIDGSHPDLKVTDGLNFADGLPTHHTDVRGHGTHVAGIIAGRGKAGKGMHGIAPEVELLSYRVFSSSGTSDTFILLKAIKQAVDDECDLINMSLGGGPADVALNEAIGSAFQRGTVCVVAAGNDSGSPVSYPAWYKRAVGVSALGQVGTFPKDSVEQADVGQALSAINKKRFLAAFSNIGSEIDFIAPGVGVISTVPDGAYAVQSGTSMACPAVTGAAAARLSAAKTKALNLPRDILRGVAIMETVRTAAVPQGFDPRHEGYGQLGL